MNKKHIVITICVVALATCAFAFARQAQKSQSIQPRHEMPDHVTYGHLFHHITALKQQASEVEQQGKDGSFFRSLYKRDANLNDDEASILDQIAADCEQEVAQQDAKARVIIDEERAQHPGGKLQQGEKLPPMPPELQRMQEERNAIILRARDRLHAALGEPEFKRFDDFVKHNFASKIKPLDVNHQRHIPHSGPPLSQHQ